MKSKADNQIPPSRSIAKGAEAQRDAIHEERIKGTFDAKKHIEASPIGQALANGFPKVPR